MKFYFCEGDWRGRCCIFTERTMEPLWKRSGGDIARCIRHGALITTERDFPDREDAEKWARPKEDK